MENRNRDNGIFGLSPEATGGRNEQNMNSTHEIENETRNGMYKKTL